VLEILDHCRQILNFFGISTQDEELELVSLYWTPILHKCSDKQLFDVGSTKCSTKSLTNSILSAVKTMASEKIKM
jgi:hypothetical protein